jgi:predicted transglutaminase-like cysteine proteinase
MESVESRFRARSWAPTLLAACLLLGCSHFSLGRAPEQPLALHQLRPALPADPFAVRIANWQLRAGAEATAIADGERGPQELTVSVGEPSPQALAPVDGESGPHELADRAASQRLRLAATDFVREQREETVRSVARWIQEQAQEAFRSDQGVDHWATLGQVYARNGDDCDGLAVLALHQLRSLGLADEALYLAVTHRPLDETHHMVLLWFPEQGDDPFVIDPTGAMTPELVRLSALPDWTALALFSEDEHWAVREGRALAGRSLLPPVAGAPPAN